MKHIKTFEAWSPKFNRTLQGAYQQAEITNKGFGKAAKSVIDYANRSISQRIFSVEFPSGNKITFTHDPEFILKPIQTFIKDNGLVIPTQYNPIVPEKNYLIIPIIIRKLITNDGEADVEKRGILLFSDGKIAKDFIGSERERTSSRIEKEDELRFSDRNGLEDFFAMTIQAVLSSPERTSYYLSHPPGIQPGDTFEKQMILDLIQKHIFDKDQRQYTM